MTKNFLPLHSSVFVNKRSTPAALSSENIPFWPFWHHLQTGHQMSGMRKTWTWTPNENLNCPVPVSRWYISVNTIRHKNWAHSFWAFYFEIRNALRYDYRIKQTSRVQREHLASSFFAVQFVSRISLDRPTFFQCELEQRHIYIFFIFFFRNWGFFLVWLQTFVHFEQWIF